MITRLDYFTAQDGTRRDIHYSNDMTPAIEASAKVTVSKSNLLLAWFRESTGDTAQRKVNSGWRPPSVNASTKGASPTSKHMNGEAIDIGDADGKLDEWLLTEVGTAALIELGLWHEHPLTSKGEPSTPKWAHWQTVPPKSGSRHFYAK